MAQPRNYGIGRRVVTLATARRRHWAADTPGYIAPVPGVTGIVTMAESHGYAPYTRYCVHFADGTRGAGLVIGQDIQFVR